MERTETLAIRLSRDTIASLRRIASEDDRPVSALARLLIERSLAAAEEKHPAPRGALR
jgi:hypothetical protein